MDSVSAFGTRATRAVGSALRLVAMAAAGILAAANAEPARAESGRAGIVTFTFDDGFQTQYSVAFPLLGERGMVGTLYIPSGFIDSKGAPSRLTWDEVREISSAGWEIGSHTVSHPHLSDLSIEAARRELDESKHDIARRIGHAPVSFSPPFGDYNDAMLAEISKDYQSSVLASGDQSGFANDPRALNRFLIARFAVQDSTAPSALCDATIAAAKHKSWLVFEFHNVVDQTSGDFDYRRSEFEKVLDCVAKLRDDGSIRVLTTSGALQEFRKLTADKGN